MHFGPAVSFDTPRLALPFNAADRALTDRNPWRIDCERAEQSLRWPARRERGGGRGIILSVVAGGNCSCPRRRLLEPHRLPIRRAAAAALPCDWTCGGCGRTRYRIHQQPSRLYARFTGTCRHPVRLRVWHVDPVFPAFRGTGNGACHGRRYSHIRLFRGRSRPPARALLARGPAARCHRRLHRCGSGVFPAAHRRHPHPRSGTLHAGGRIRHQRSNGHLPHSRPGRDHRQRTGPGRYRQRFSAAFC